MKRATAANDTYEHVMMCLICRSLFDDHEHQPKFLPCHHTFCKECLRQYVQQMGDEIECPSCRKVATIPAAGVAALQTNFYAKYIQNLVYGCGGSSASWVGDCPNHPGHRLVHFCKDCAISVCDVCVQDRGCLQHQRDLLTAVMEKYRCDIDTAFTKTNALIETKKVELESHLKMLAEEKDSALIKIDSTFEQHMHTLSRRSTLLKNKVIDIYNEHAAKLEADLEEISTGMTCIISLKEHYEPMISVGDFVDSEKGIEEMQEVHRNLSERIRPRMVNILFEEKHGTEIFHNSVKDLGRVVSKMEPLPLKSVAPIVSDLNIQSASGIDDVSPDGRATNNCDLESDSVSEVSANQQPVLCSISAEIPVSTSSTSSFKTEMSLNIKNNCLINPLKVEMVELNNNPSTGENRNKLLQVGSIKSDYGQADEFVIPNAEMMPTNVTFINPIVTTNEEVTVPMCTSSVSTNSKGDQVVTFTVKAVPAKCEGSIVKGDKTKLIPSVRDEGMVTGNQDRVKSADTCTSLYSCLPGASCLSRSNAECEDAASQDAEKNSTLDPGYHYTAHKSYDEPRMKLELGYEASDVDDTSTTPSRQMSRSDFWLMMSSSIESNLSDHDLIVAELSGEQTSL